MLDNAAVKEWTRTADNSAPPSTENSNPNNEDADGASWAPGGLGAINSIVVKGRGLHVDTGELCLHRYSTIGATLWL